MRKNGRNFELSTVEKDRIMKLSDAQMKCRDVGDVDTGFNK